MSQENISNGEVVLKVIDGKKVIVDTTVIGGKETRLKKFSKKISFHYLKRTIVYPISQAPKIPKPHENSTQTPPKHDQNSVVTVFALWNSMLGTSFLIIPWAVIKAGFGFSTVVMLLFTLISLYTAYLIVHSQEQVNLPGTSEPNFNIICQHYLGSIGSNVAFAFSMLSLVSAGIVFYIFTTNYLYYIVDFLYELGANGFQLQSITSTDALCVSDASSHPEPYTTTINPMNDNSTNEDFILNNGTNAHSNISMKPSRPDLYNSVWSINLTVPLFLVLILFPLISIKSPTFFVKFNAVGVLSILYMLAFVTFKSVIWGVHLNFIDPSHVSYISNFKWTFPTLSGVLLMAYFIHNGVLSILQHQKDPSKNTRDLSIAFFLVMFTFAYMGLMFSLSYPLSKDCIADNLLNNIPSTDILAFIGRIFLFLQLVTVFPLLIFILRQELFKKMFPFKSPGMLHIVILNLGLMTCFVILAIFYPNVGNITRYFGSICGLGYIFVLPLLVRLVHLKRQNQLKYSHCCIFIVLVAIGTATFLAQFFM